MYWGASVEVQIPIYGVPKDFGMRIAVFADAGSVWDYKGPRLFPATGTSVTTVDPFTGVDTDSMTIRSSVGAGLIWDSPFGPIRFDYAFPLTKERERPGPGAALRRRHEVLDLEPRHGARWHDRAAVLRAPARA